jgi:chromosome segregation ATPase
MTVKSVSGRNINHKLLQSLALSSFAWGFAVFGLAGTAVSEDREDHQRPALEELKDHAATIDDILSEASRRVDQLAGSNGEPTALVDAIRQELSLSRRWNKHLATILLDVAEARRDLSRRERQAAQEIARMTAVAEEARLELIELKKVLDDRPEETAPSPNLAPNSPNTQSDRSASERQMNAVAQSLAGPGADIDDARLKLDSMQEAQQLAIDDVEAVRSKIIEALQTLGDLHGHPVILKRNEHGDLTSGDITAWAVSTATRMQRSNSATVD